MAHQQALGLRVEHHDAGATSVPVLSVAGEVDLANSDELAVAIASQLRDDLACLIVDFADLSFIDSSGLQAVVQGRRAALDAGGDLVLAAPQTIVKRIIELSGLDDYFECFVSTDEALESALDRERSVEREADRASSLGPAASPSLQAT